MFNANQNHKKPFTLFGYKLFMYPEWLETVIAILCFLGIWYVIFWGALNFDMEKHVLHHRISKEQTCLNHVRTTSKDATLSDVTVVKNKCYILIK